MQQLEIEHKNVPKKDRRSGQGRCIALSRRIYRILQTDVFYVESESTDGMYYFVKLKHDVIEYCSCPDNSYRGNTCKHIFGVIAGIKKGIIIDIEKLPKEAKRDNTVSKSYRDDFYEY